MESLGFTLWFTGMSGAGKRTLARFVSKRFSLLGRRWELLEGAGLGDLFPESPDATLEIRDRNTRSLGWAAELLTRNGVITLVAAVSPHREVRDELRKRIGRFAEVFVDCPFETLLLRDAEGVYKRALAGELENVVGVQAPYEPPLQPEAVVHTGTAPVEEQANQLFERLYHHGFLSRTERDVLIGALPPVALAQQAAAEEEASPSEPRSEAQVVPLREAGGEGSTKKAAKAKGASGPSRRKKEAATAAPAKAVASPSPKVKGAPRSAARRAAVTEKAPKPAAPKAASPKRGAKAEPKAASPKRASKIAGPAAAKAKSVASKASSKEARPAVKKAVAAKTAGKAGKAGGATIAKKPKASATKAKAGTKAKAVAKTAPTKAAPKKAAPRKTAAKADPAKAGKAAASSGRRAGGAKVATG